MMSGTEGVKYIYQGSHKPIRMMSGFEGVKYTYQGSHMPIRMVAGIEGVKYSGTSVHERHQSGTNRFTNKFSEQKTSWLTKGVSINGTQDGNNGKRQAGSIGGRASVAV
jgi:hypothetical protein